MFTDCADCSLFHLSGLVGATSQLLKATNTDARVKKTSVRRYRSKKGNFRWPWPCSSTKGIEMDIKFNEKKQ